MTRLSRRAFLATAARLGVGAAAIGSLPGWSRRVLAAGTAVPADIIVRSDYPEHWETSLEALGRNWLTPNDLFFVRSHFLVPDVDPEAYRVEVTGRVAKPITLTLAEVRALPAVKKAVVLECAGNGRGLFHLPNTSGTQWEYGAVGNAEWSGPTLAALLERAGVAPEGKHVWFECDDGAPLETVPKFVRSIPIEKATRDVLMAHTMNGAPLPRLHGAPLRAIVPGWYGMASAKWVTRIRVEDRPSDNHFMVKGYRYVPPGGDPAKSPPVQEVRVKSVITHFGRRPDENVAPFPDPFAVGGMAWSGAGGIRSVEISIDDHGWEAASFGGMLGETNEPLAWRSWWSPMARRPRVIRVRATDDAGNVQPVAAEPNTGGYGNNSIHRMEIATK